MKITIINYGLSNLLSVERAFLHFGADVEITSDPAVVAAACALVLPGVGAFEDGMKGLDSLGLTDAIKAAAAKGVPLLGICLGMQMLFDESDEFGLHTGLGLIPGRVEKILPQTVDGAPQRVPNIGWNALTPAGNAIAAVAGFDAAPISFDGTALANVPEGGECYFVHSFEAKPTSNADRLADTLYGGRRVCAAAQKGNVLGTQFHPEKSGPVGLSIIKKYLALCEG
ncbi:MAG: imidazole glycerol phosphate synthase subunit HisH [Faecalibacterium sp.]